MRTEAYKPFQKGSCIRDGLFLALLCLAGCAAYFNYDIPGTLSVDINDNLNIEVDDFMAYFYTAYSLPSAVTAMLSGYIINFLGLGRGGIVLSLLMAVSQFLLTLSMKFQMPFLAAAGRLLHGSAAEPWGVVRAAFTAKYFNGAIFYGLTLSCARAGSVGGIKLTPIILCLLRPDSPSCLVSKNSVNSTNGTNVEVFQDGSENLYDLQTALAICFLVGSAFALIFGFLSMVTINRIDKNLDRKRGLTDVAKKDPLKFSDIGEIPIVCWALIFVFTTWYMAFFNFNSMLPGYIKSYCGLSKEVASNLASIVYLLSVVGSPALGLVVDRTRHHPVWLFSSSSLLTACLFLWGYLQPRTEPEAILTVFSVLVVLMGLAYSILAGTISVYVAEKTPSKLLPTCMGLLFGFQQLGVGLAGWMAGGISAKLGYGVLPYFAAMNGLLSVGGGIFLLVKDGVDPLSRKADGQVKEDSSDETFLGTSE